MKTESSESITPAMILGIEGGGTKTTWCLVQGDGDILAEGVAGPGNVALLSKDELSNLISSIAQSLPVKPSAIGAGMAGVIDRETAERVKLCLSTTFPAASRIVVESDMKSGFFSAHPSGAGILALAGTGSFVLGRARDTWIQADGWGHVAGDRGSAYHLAETALRRAYVQFDEHGETSALAGALLAYASENSLTGLALWVTQNSSRKDAIASLAPAVIAAAEQECPIALECVSHCSRDLAASIVAVARRLDVAHPEIVFGGGLLQVPIYRKAVEECLFGLIGKVKTRLLDVPGARGAVRLVSEVCVTEDRDRGSVAGEVRASATERRNPRTRHLENRSVENLVELFLDESSRVIPALKSISSKLIQAVDIVHATLKNGGRLFYVGAGTSGRLGVLDASEVPPTFGLSPTVVQGIMAGGSSALALGREDVEDDPEAGRLAIRQRGVGADDVVLGIAASGRTPFVLAALAEARSHHARVGLLSCNPQRPIPPFPLDFAIDVPTEPEFVSGSTRLAAGTATKIALNLLTTIVMIRLGKVQDNLMIDVEATNAKLRERAIHMLSELTGCSDDSAFDVLKKHQWKVRAALTEIQGSA